jgi:D-sedoheptulose 7-phosphate isomerase
MVEIVENNLKDSIRLKTDLLNNIDIIENSYIISEKIIECYHNKGKVYFCGNGGSFADAQHLSAELSGRFYFDRDPLEVVLLSSNISYLTAVGNDYDYSEIFSREIKSSIKKNDILICFSTSGRSKNIIKAAEIAKNKSVLVVSFTGYDGGDIKNISDISIVIPSNDTARIQECHMLLGHSILEIVENKIFKK